MKRTIKILALALLPVLQLKAQVKIGDNPTTIGASSILELEKSDKALVVTRVDAVISIVNPTNGMIIYDKSMECFRVYQNGKWSECMGEYIAPPPPGVNGLGCTGKTVAPSSALLNTAYTGTVTLPYYGGNGGAYPAQLIPSTGVTGLTAQLLAGTLNAAGNLYFTVTGTPKSTGNALFALTLGGHSCTFNIPVTYPAAVASTNCAGKTWTGSTLTAGKTAAVGDTAKVPYIDGNGGYYNALAISSTGVTGLVASAPSGYVQTGNGILSLSISGTPTVSGVARFILNFAGTTCNLELTVIPGGPVVSAFNCSSTTFSPGTIYSGTPYSGTATIPYTGGNGQAYTAGAGVPSTGVTGLTATPQAGTLANGSGNLTYAISGTPNTSGTASFSLSFGGQTCNLATTVSTTPATLPAGTGTFTGKTCFDIASGNNNTNNCGVLTARELQKDDFMQAASRIKSYTFTPTGAVSNVRFMYVNTNGDVITSVSGNNAALNITVPVIATVSYNADLNNSAQGLTSSNPLTADIYVVFNDKGDGTGVDRQLKLTAKVKDCNCCGAYIAAGVWKAVMCHNLGAKTDADPFTPSWELNGAYIQWGKRGPTGPTGNSAIDWQTAPNNGPLGFAAAPTNGTPAGSNTGTISGWCENNQPATSWNSGTEFVPVKTAIDPCPTGWRTMTKRELDGILTYNAKTYKSVIMAAVKYDGEMRGSMLFFPYAGLRNPDSSFARWNMGNYWTNYMESMPFYWYYGYASAQSSTFSRQWALPIRCIAE